MHPEEFVSSLEPSKKLKKLGVKQDGFFSWCEVELPSGKKTQVCSQDLLMYYDVKGIVYTKLCSAFTFTEGTKRLPFHISLPHHPEKSYYLSIIPHQSGRLNLMYLTIDNIHLFKQTDSTKDADSAVEMLIPLMEQGIVKPDNHP
jgi:hypothetical protein